MTTTTRIQNILTQLATGPELVINLINEVPQSVRKWRPEPGKWSAHEHAVHLPQVQPMMMQRLELMLTDPSPVIKPYIPADDDAPDMLLDIDLDEAMQRFAHERLAMIQRLTELTAEQWQITAEHAEYSQYSVWIMFRHLAMHDLYHAYRIEERMLDPNAPHG